MKKLLGVSALAMMLAACSSSNNRPEPAAQGVAPGPNQQVEAALKACAETVGQADQAKFDACMKEKGFEKPAEQPAPGAAAGAAPAGDQAAVAAEEPAAKKATAKKAKAKKSAKKAKKSAKK